MIDLFNNGRNQFIFNSENNIYLLDVEGNMVENFPIKLEMRASAGLSVIDYRGTKEYRFILPLIDKRIINLTPNGKATAGSYHLVTSQSAIFQSVPGKALAKTGW